MSVVRSPRPAHRSRRAAAGVAVLAAAPVAVAGLAFAPAALAAPGPTPPDPTPPATTPAATTTTLVPTTGAEVAAGAKLRLRIRVTPAVAGTVTVTDGSKQVDELKVRDGRAKSVLIPRKGPHSYTATFTPKYPGKYASSASAPVAVAAGIARALPVGRSAYGPLVGKIQQRLVWSGILLARTGTYDRATVAAVKRFQGKFFLNQTGVVNQRTMTELRQLAVKRPPRACRTVSKSICIDKTRKVAQLVVNGKVRMSLDARFGSVSSPGLATREGIFSIQRKAVQHISSAYHTSMPYSMFFSGGQAVHYSQYFAADGYSGASHGCVNIRDYKGVAKMYARSPIGTRVVVYRS